MNDTPLSKRGIYDSNNLENEDFLGACWKEGRMSKGIYKYSNNLEHEVSRAIQFQLERDCARELLKEATDLLKNSHADGFEEDCDDCLDPYDDCPLATFLSKLSAPKEGAE